MRRRDFNNKNKLTPRQAQEFKVKNDRFVKALQNMKNWEEWDEGAQAIKNKKYGNSPTYTNAATGEVEYNPDYVDES
jgi:hypothetical protein